MVRYLADYEHRNDSFCRVDEPNVSASAAASLARGAVTHNILLEWGEFDLEDLFTEREPPVLEAELRWFWEQLFEVATAVRGIHHFERERGQVREEYYGYVTPQNSARLNS